ncbi:MAG: hypothetical protein EBR86_14915 [Planctomycetia bacterium]|nr:hypothetical protein [Planctomycetia bacterium]
MGYSPAAVAVGLAEHIAEVYATTTRDRGEPANLYGGSAGVAVFLAAVASRYRRPVVRDAALSLAEELLAWAPRNWGLIDGHGARLYACWWLARLLDRSDLAASARDEASAMPDEAASGSDLDLLSGLAGWVLVAARMGRERQVTDLGAGVARARKRLVAGLTQATTASLHPGFAHGAAGLAVALAAAGEVAGALACVEHEKLFLDLDRRDWPDTRASHPRWPRAWCWGGAGVLLGRLVLHTLGVRDPLVERDIFIGLDGLLRAPKSPIDQACCGNLGRIDILLTAARVLDEPRLAAVARRHGEDLLGRLAAGGKLSAGKAGVVSEPGLFQGLAGVGWIALRLAGDEPLPSFLAWELA